MKQLKYLLLILPFLFIGSVKADSIEYDYSFHSAMFNVENYSEFVSVLDENDKIISSLYSDLLQFYNSNYSSEYPYYIIAINYNSNIVLELQAAISPFYFKVSDVGANTFLENGETLKFENHIFISTQYSFEKNTYFTSQVVDSLPLASFSFQPPLVYETNFIDSNFDLKIYTDFDNIVIHNFRDTNSDFIINSGDVYPTYFKNSIPTNNKLVEVNLNDYAYVALSLKDYKQDPFSSQVYAKGNYCITPVYNYGMTERNEILSGTKVERCSPYYEIYTPIRTYITDSDLNNNAIYYLKAYDTSKDNYVKIDTSIFDITYITEENKDDPYVMINGKSYPTIPYDSLTDTATKSEDEGYASGVVTPFDPIGTAINTFKDIFTAPLEFLEDLWDSIKSVFSLIKELFSLLPEPLPTFLTISFTLAIVLGLLKIIL